MGDQPALPSGSASRCACAALAFLLLASRAAAAEDFATLDRQDRSSSFGASLTYFSLANQGQFGRLDLALQAVEPASGLGAYAQMPFVLESDQGGNTTLALGGAEVGAIVASPSGVTFHAGLVLPTASSGDNAAPIAATAVVRLSDFIGTLPNSTSARAGIAYSFRSCELFGRIELAVDIPISVDASFGLAFDGQLAHLNAAIGFDAGDFTLTAESTNAYQFGGFSPSYDVLAAAIRFRTGMARPYLAAIIPIDGQQNEPKVAFVAGMTLPLQR